MPAATSASAPSADATAGGDEDDDWPTRYSWLDDEADEGSEPATNDVDPDPAKADTAKADTAKAGEDETAAAPSGPGAGAASEAAGPEPATEPGTVAGTADAATSGLADAGETDADETETGDADTGDATGEPGDDVEVDDVTALEEPSDSDEPWLLSASGWAAEEPEGAEEADAAEVAEAPEPADADADSDSEPQATAEEGAAPESSLVAVVRGVPRYHQPDCVLILFMPDSDVHKLPIPEARELGCTPCTACQREG